MCMINFTKANNFDMVDKYKLKQYKYITFSTLLFIILSFCVKKLYNTFNIVLQNLCCLTQSYYSISKTYVHKFQLLPYYFTAVRTFLVNIQKTYQV